MYQNSSVFANIDHQQNSLPSFTPTSLPLSPLHFSQQHENHALPSYQTPLESHTLSPQQQQQQQHNLYLKPVQKRTKAACVHCQAAKVACSSMRPCVWCIRHGMQDSCVDAPKKERRVSKRRREEKEAADPVVSPHHPPASPQISLPSSSSPPSSTPAPSPSLYPQVIPITTLLPQAPLLDFSAVLDTGGLFEESNLLPFGDPSMDSLYRMLANIPSSPVYIPSSPSSSLPSDPSLPPPFVDPISPETTTYPLPLSSPLSPSPSPLPDTIQNLAPLIDAEVRKAQTCMENVGMLMQLQQHQHTLPSALYQIPDLAFQDCNDAFAHMLEYGSAQDLLNAKLTLVDLVFPVLKPLLQRRAVKMGMKLTPKIVRTAIFISKLGTPKCCTILVCPMSPYLKMYVLRSATGVPERAARKLECISALTMTKGTRITEDDAGACC